MKVSIVAIGDELLIGQVTDTNSGYIARSLNAKGWELDSVRVVSDTESEIINAIEEGMRKCRVVITTGGLGPTKDDITKESLMKIFGGELVHNPEVELNVRQIVTNRKINLNSLTLSQAQVPSSCKVFQNRYGTAPVMWFEKDSCVVVSLPGVPFEMQGMWDEVVFPELQKKFDDGTTVKHRTMIVTGITESDLALRLEKWEDALPPYLHLAYLPTPGLIRLRLDGRHADADYLEKEMDEYFNILKGVVGPNLFVDDDLNPAEVLLSLLKEARMSVAVAESCTGGAIASAITSVPGSSQSFKGGVVAYSNEVKQSVLGVKNSTLASHGAVSEEVVREMAEGVAAVCRSHCSIATSGIAGPGGATSGKPVGTVCIGVRIGEKTFSYTFHFPGDRKGVVERSVRTSIIMLANKLKEQ